MNAQLRSVFRHVLHPTDFTPESELAFCHGLAIALGGHSELSIVHTEAGHNLGHEWSAFPAVRETLARWGRLPPDASQEDVTALGVKIHKLDLAATEPGPALHDYASKNDCDLVVLATHARRGLERWVHPSTAIDLARRAGQKGGAQTLFLPKGAPGFVDPKKGAVRLRNVLIPFDHSPNPERAIRTAVSLARNFGAFNTTFHLLHVGLAPPSLPEAALEGLKVQVHLAQGNVADTIVYVSEQLDADLIVMATQGQNSLSDAIVGTTAEQVLRRAGRALLAVPEM